MGKGRRIPVATCRLQLSRGFTFHDAARLAGYLDRLGITDCYLSPIFRAGPESTHGYDVCGFDQVHPVLGGSEGLDKLSTRLRKRHMGILLDMVPNHMDNDLSNHWWVDVLEHGQHSRYASWFDIDWEPQNLGWRGQVLLPVLEDRYGKVLEAGKLRIVRDGDKLALAYYERRFPLNRAGTEAVLEPLGAHPSEKQMEARLRLLNGIPGQPDSFDELDRIIRIQSYRLAFWRIGPEEINYRRFFDITELVSMRMELPEVFEESHKLLFELIRAGIVTGVRIDHPDGLWNPKQYFERLQQAGPSYVVVEKILSGQEWLPEDWPVDGTTGYDFLNLVNGLFVNRAAEQDFSDLYREVTGVDAGTFETLVAHCKRWVLQRSFGREISALTHRLKALALRTRAGRDFTLNELRAAVFDLVTAFPVYRTYITEKTRSVSQPDRVAIQKAHDQAERFRSGNQDALRFLCSLLLLEAEEKPREVSPATLDFIMRFQQLTGPVMAKGLEDTAFYRYARLISLNEVGGEPNRFGYSRAEFHALNLQRQQRWPHALLATATHDTKRGEDVRARLNVLTEMPRRWAGAVSNWQATNEAAKTRIDLETAPHANEEYFIYQTIVGAWPPLQQEPSEEFIDRIAAAIQKSIKEAKAHTSWIDPNSVYEQAVDRFVRAILRPGNDNRFVTSVCEFVEPIAFHGCINSIAQTVLKIASPGVPDFYQGTELWDLNLVDPDNRRQVDYRLRESMLSELERKFTQPQGVDVKGLWSDWPSGRVKLFTLWKLLNFRKHNAALFQTGAYLPLEIDGQWSRHLCAFARTLGRQALIVVVPRFTCTLLSGARKPPLGMEIWRDTHIEIPEALRGQFTDAFTGKQFSVTPQLQAGEILSDFVCAALYRRGDVSQTP